MFASINQLKRALKIKVKLEALQNKLDRLLGTGSSSGAPPKRKMSAAGRARIIAAQKARWAKKKGGKHRRKMSAAGRARIAAAARARWRAVKAAGKNKL
jgi:hypothetical protein